MVKISHPKYIPGLTVPCGLHWSHARSIHTAKLSADTWISISSSFRIVPFVSSSRSRSRRISLDSLLLSTNFHRCQGDCEICAPRWWCLAISQKLVEQIMRSSEPRPGVTTQQYKSLETKWGTSQVFHFSMSNWDLVGKSCRNYEWIESRFKSQFVCLFRTKCIHLFQGSLSHQTSARSWWRCRRKWRTQFSGSLESKSN